MGWDKFGLEPFVTVLHLPSLTPDKRMPGQTHGYLLNVLILP